MLHCIIRHFNRNILNLISVVLQMELHCYGTHEFSFKLHTRLCQTLINSLSLVLAAFSSICFSSIRVNRTNANMVDCINNATQRKKQNLFLFG